ncbi:VOC family protein [Paenibacillus psychroresistens]|uniref:VOC family protein n=1 Tax=Paenibacillus psychroresistens TaxID=1778678 RepID=A0A6B8RKX1_9BACL|nr:VOC family protein [Paenibacillus psychroresistens]QGQ96497.1 VOC family protein [Paenibacillus psychroresistens]
MQTSNAQGSGIKSVGSAILHVRNLNLMVSWYGDILGTPITEIESETPYYVFEMINGVNLMLDDHRFMQDQAKHPIFMLNTMDIEASYNWAKQNEITINLEIQHVHPGLSYFNISDSEGNVMMIIQSNWVNPNSQQLNELDKPIVNHINSIVVPVTDLKRATEWYAHLLGHVIKPDRQTGGPIYWFDMENGTGVLLDDNRSNGYCEKYPTFMLKGPDIEEAYRFIVSKNIKTLTEVEFDNHFFISDPEGNSIII